MSMTVINIIAQIVSVGFVSAMVVAEVVGIVMEVRRK